LEGADEGRSPRISSSSSYSSSEVLELNTTTFPASLVGHSSYITCFGIGIFEDSFRAWNLSLSTGFSTRGMLAEDASSEGFSDLFEGEEGFSAGGSSFFYSIYLALAIKDCPGSSTARLPLLLILTFFMMEGLKGISVFLFSAFLGLAWIGLA